MAFALDPALPKDLLSHLVVVDISPAVGPISPEFRNYIHAMHEINAAKVQTKKQAEEILKKIESDPSVRAFLLHNLVAPSKGEPLQFRIPLSIIENGIDGIGDFPHTPERKSGMGRPWASTDRTLWGIQSVHAEKPQEFVDLVAKFVSQK
ncbi:alpha/beta hydrolase family protein [Ceratobasidium sp. AG-Ba]|nr:alpha/beta hydrolase family protein [Ceratobasidium sp. AG-Ba]